MMENLRETRALNQFKFVYLRRVRNVGIILLTHLNGLCSIELDDFLVESKRQY